MTLQNMYLSHISEHPWHLGHRRCPETCRQPPRWRGATVAFFVGFTVRDADLVAASRRGKVPTKIGACLGGSRPLEQRSMGTRVYNKGCWIQGQSLGQGRRPPPAATNGETDHTSPQRLLLPDGLLLPFRDDTACEASLACSGDQTGNDDSCRFKSVVCTAALRADEILDGLSHDGSSTRRPS